MYIYIYVYICEILKLRLLVINSYWNIHTIGNFILLYIFSIFCLTIFLALRGSKEFSWKFTSLSILENSSPRWETVFSRTRYDLGPPAPQRSRLRLTWKYLKPYFVTVLVAIMRRLSASLLQAAHEISSRGKKEIRRAGSARNDHYWERKMEIGNRKTESVDGSQRSHFLEFSESPLPTFSSKKMKKYKNSTWRKNRKQLEGGERGDLQEPLKKSTPAPSQKGTGEAERRRRLLPCWPEYRSGRSPSAGSWGSSFSSSRAPSLFSSSGSLRHCRGCCQSS